MFGKESKGIRKGFIDYLFSVYLPMGRSNGKQFKSLFSIY